MRIRGCAPVGHDDGADHTDVPLLVIDAENDGIEKHGLDSIKRTITGKITSTEEYWQAYLSIWSAHYNDAFKQLHVRDLIVDFDWYSTDCVIAIADDDSIKIELLEGFAQPLDSYQAELQKRNKLREELQEKVLAGSGALDLYKGIDHLTPIQSDDEFKDKYSERISGLKFRYNCLIA